MWTRALADLAGQAVLRTDYGGVQVLDAGRLLELAGQDGLTGDPC